MEELTKTTVSSLMHELERRRVSARELVEAHVARIEALHDDLNAVVTLEADRALEQADAADRARGAGEAFGPLSGVPMTVKDSLETQGVRSTGGTLGRKDYVGETDATVVRRLRRAGAILLGKTNTPELTLSYETTNAIFGQTRNPYGLTRTPGGSSGGAAANVASGGTPFEIGSDYGGSIRYPSHCCGLAGIKPSRGRVSRDGHIFPWGGLLDSFQQIGPIARSVDDLVLILRLIEGVDGRDPHLFPYPWIDPSTVAIGGLRVAYYESDGVAEASEAVRASVRSAALALEARGAIVEEATPSCVADGFEIAMSLWAADGGAQTRRLLAHYGTTEPAITLPPREPLGAVELEALIHRWDEFRSLWTQFVHDYDVVLSPVNAQEAQPIGESELDFRRFSYTMTHNATGLPGVVVRAGESSEGLPVGVQLVSRLGGDHVALAVAAVIEEELGGYQPPKDLA